jgi:hypothetical protein
MAEEARRAEETRARRDAMAVVIMCASRLYKRELSVREAAQMEEWTATLSWLMG